MAEHYREYVGGKYWAADGGNYGIWILDIDEGKSDFIVVSIMNDDNVSEHLGLHRIDCFQATYKYKLSINNPCSNNADEQKLLYILDKVDEIFESEATWEYKFDRIFGMSEETRALLRSVNLVLDYCDPDTTYEEDVRAYVNALRAIRKNLESHL